MPRDAAPVTDVASFVTQMSDLLSTGVLFAALIVWVIGCKVEVRGELTMAVNRLFAEAADKALRETARPLEMQGPWSAELCGRLQRRLHSLSDLTRAIAFQREVDAVGIRWTSRLMLKIAIPAGTFLVRLIRSLT